MSEKGTIKRQFGKSPGSENTSKPQSGDKHAVVSGTGRKRARPDVQPAVAMNHDDDEFAGMEDIIRTIDLTPFKSNTSSRISSASSSRPQSELSHANQQQGASNIECKNDVTVRSLHAELTESKLHKPSQKQSSVTKENPSDDNEDAFDSIHDDDIIEYYNSSTMLNNLTERSLFSNVMQKASSSRSLSSARKVTLDTREEQNQKLTARDESNYRLEDREEKTVTNMDSNEDSNRGDASDEDENVMLSLKQFTQEEIDFDAMYESGDSNQGDSMAIEGDNKHDNKRMQQPTISQYLSKGDNPTRTQWIPSIAGEYKGRQYHVGDFWRYVTTSASKDNDIPNNLIVKIEGSTNDRVRGRKRERVAKVENKFYLPIEDVEWLGDHAQSVLENRRAKGNVVPDLVEFKLLSSDVPRFALSMLNNRITTNVTSDLIFGYHGKSSTKGGCFFKYHEVANSGKKQISIPRNPEGKFTALELYSGAGGFSLGLEDAGFSVTHHVDNDTAACSTLKTNFPESQVLQSTVEDFLEGCRRNPTSRRYPKVGSIALIHGSTPCQGFSLANRNGGANDAANNAETRQFIGVVKHFQPPFVTFENVEGILYKKNKNYVQKMIAEFLNMEYQVRLCFLTASDYGDPQNRNRVIILAAKTGLELPHLPQPTHGEGPSLLAKRTVGDAIGFLQNVNPLEYEGGVDVMVNGVSLDLQGHILRSSERKKDGIDLVADAAAPTVTKRRVIRHYGCNNRQLTRLERSLLQSFPCTYEFSGTSSEILDQIGNAVPVCLSRAIGKSVMDAIVRSRKDRVPAVRNLKAAGKGD